MNKRITKASLERLQPNSTLWDAELKGFGADRRNTETITFFVKTRIKGRQRWITIGKWKSPWTAETARAEAQVILGQRHKGIDAGLEKERDRKRGLSLAEVFDLYLDAVRPPQDVTDRKLPAKVKPATYSSYERAIRRRWKPWFGTKAIKDITPEDIAEAHADWDEDPIAANRAVKLLSVVFNWAGRKGYVAKGLDITNQVEFYDENKRQRYLHPEEAARLANVLKTYAKNKKANPLVLAQIWLIIFTGARKGEISSLKWIYIDKHRQQINLPDSKTGPRSISLSQYALAIIDRIPRYDGQEYVFTGRQGGPIKRYFNVWKIIRQEAGLPDLRIHDLRHSFGSWAVDAGGEIRVIADTMGHSTLEQSKDYTHVKGRKQLALTQATGRQIARDMGLETSVPKLKTVYKLRKRRPRPVRLAL